MSLPLPNFKEGLALSAWKFPSPSHAEVYNGLTKIENLTYRVGYLSSFLPAAHEMIQFIEESPFYFCYFQTEVGPFSL